jgi:hypothetical protein
MAFTSSTWSRASAADAGGDEEIAMAYLLIALMAVLIFLAMSDFVEGVTQATAEWERARSFSKKQVR